MSVALIITVVLVLGVIFVNGWTDAPNAIATVVSTHCMSPKKAIAMAAVFNFFGVLVMTIVNSKVAATIGNMANFGTNDQALIALAAGLFAIVVFALVAWYFGIPTSESHALIAGVCGAALTTSGLSSINLDAWYKVLLGLIISSLLGFIAGYLVTKIIEFSFKHVKRTKTTSFFKWAQISSGAATAFFHGAQDGQKFIGVLILGTFLAKGMNVPEAFDVSIWIMIICSLVMGLGTSIGGYRIIKSVGMDMVKLEKYQGFCADLSASICMLIASWFGIPVSTTHTKTTAIMGVGASKRISNVNWKVVKDMVLAWVLTFPICGLIGYLMSLLFLQVF
ncbi:MAG: inorganic phosphate transporter [Clostridiales bacterium]|jgi:PiT family inorganic phosphate transporter|nr:inorganic phosphate transporter [Clostridiales bacterium]